jgi:hypothetical protein
MKKQTNAATKAHLIRGAFLLVFFAGVLLTLFAAPDPQALTRERTRNTREQAHRANPPPIAPAGGVYEAWVARYNGTGNGYDEAKGVAVDNSGNVYVAGTSWGLGTLNDYATIKYDSAGQQQWVARYNAPDGASGQDIAVDVSGNVYVAAFASNQFNTLFCATIEYNAAGEQLWVAEYHGGAGADEPAAIVIDTAGNVYVTGTTQTCPGSDYLTLKYNSAGQEQWVARYYGPQEHLDAAKAIAVDDAGNVYVTGNSFGSHATVKYNTAGQQQWAARYDQGGYNAAAAIALDNSGNVFVTGQVNDANGYPDYGTIKYNASGQQQWVARYNGPPGQGADVATAIALDGSGNVYVTGRSSRTNFLFFDFGYATIKYNSAGQEQWVARYDGPGNADNEAEAIALDQLGSVYSWLSLPPRIHLHASKRFVLAE